MLIFALLRADFIRILHINFQLNLMFLFHFHGRKPFTPAARWSIESPAHLSIDLNQSMANHG